MDPQTILYWLFSGLGPVFFVVVFNEVPSLHLYKVEQN